MKVLSAYLEMGFVDAKKNTIECAIDSNSKKYIRSFTLVLRYENIYDSMFHHREDEKLNVTDRCALSDCELQIVFWKLRSELSECLEERRLRCHGKRYGDKQHSGYGLLPVSCLRISPGHNASTKVTDQKSLELCIPFKFRKTYKSARKRLPVSAIT
ncbi:Coiled-coil domain-containing protein 191 [Frankliniella fusca]|uniref:Coiled-coil domain-containing protein 191 n=1 Tax=Frankliniella fusca TaxID=407009 RepID=A0AAE1LHI0_9NEOP|nr:Coiled-coil domain-containing protein 191 [Frankliniella fusca]